MTRITLTKWTCDRCGREITTAPHDQPPRWASIYLIDPPLMATTESDELPTLVCDRCARAYRKWEKGDD